MMMTQEPAAAAVEGLAGLDAVPEAVDCESATDSSYRTLRTWSQSLVRGERGWQFVSPRWIRDHAEPKSVFEKVDAAATLASF